MAELITFHSKAEISAKDNLMAFIDVCRNELTVFGKDLLFDASIWDITAYISLKGFGNKKHRLVFSNFETSNLSTSLPMEEPFLSFSKAYIRYLQGIRPVKGVSNRIVALRALDLAMREAKLHEACVSKLNIQIFNRAAQLILEKYDASAAYRHGQQLEMISSFLSENRLITHPINWKNFIRRPHGPDKIGEEFDARRKEKMPSEASLNALPEIFLNASEPMDILVSSIAAILLSSPDRISEVLSLPLKCEFEQKTEASKEVKYGIRWWPAKGAEPMIKWIIPSMTVVVKSAIEKIRDITEDARKIAKWYENFPDQIYLSKELEYLRTKTHLDLAEVALILGFSRKTSADNWCRNNKISKVGSLIEFTKFEQAITKLLPAGFPVFDKETGLKFSEALFITRTNELDTKRSTFNCLISPVDMNQINTRLGSRVEHGFPSIFTKFGYFEPDGKDIAISTHQFRHYLNTLAQAGGLSQLDIAKWSGRLDVRQNDAYDHLTTSEIIQKIRASIGDEGLMFGPLAKLSQKTLIRRDEFSRLIIPTAHTTEIGFCVHDYTMSPCQQHMDCINCKDLICLKGSNEKEKNLRIQLDEARELLSKAENAKKEDFCGSEKWLEHHKKTVERLEELISIIDNPNVPHGALIQLSDHQTRIEEKMPESSNSSQKKTFELVLK